MEPKQTTLTLGGSLPVPYVQDLAKQSLATVPYRYLRPDQHTPSAPSSTTCPPQIPVIDMEKLLSQQFMDSELGKFHDACKEWGFFQLINHGVSLKLVEKLKEEARNFFNLPSDEKKKVSQLGIGGIEGYGQSFVISEEQKLDWSDKLSMTTLPTHLRNPRLFANLHLPLRTVIEAYSIEIENLSKKLMGLMVKALRTEASELMGAFEEGRQSLRINYYPPCPQPERVVGISPHSDASGLTFLVQADETQGLQIKKDGKWVSVQCLPDAFLLNIGDILEIMTNGVYPSIEHRAMVNSVKERLSIATFCSPRLDAEIGPMPGVITPENPPRFRRIRFIDYFKGFLARELGGKSCVDLLRIDTKRSHFPEI